MVVPGLVALFYETTNPKPDYEIWSATQHRGYELSDTDSIATMNDDVIRRNVTQSYLFMLVDEYVPTEINFAIEIVCTMMMVTIFSNIPEGYIYARIYLFCRRSENKSHFDSVLSEECRIKRHRAKTVNLQMKCLSWSLEFLSGLLCMIQFICNDDHINESSTLYIALSTSTVFLSFIVIPVTYLINTEVCKAVVVVQGWQRSAQTFVELCRTFGERNAVHDANGAHGDPVFIPRESVAQRFWL